MKYQIQMIIKEELMNPYILTDAGNGPEFATEMEGLGRIEYSGYELEEGICDARRVLSEMNEFEEFFDEGEKGAAIIMILPIT